MNCECKYSPTIIVPGIGQSKVDLYSEDGKRIKSAWPLQIDTKKFIKRIIPFLPGLLLLKKDTLFCKALKKAVREAVHPLSVNNFGVSTENLHVVDYEGKSVAECSDKDKEHIYKMVPMQRLSEVVGENHIYFFAYNSFGEPYETAKNLDEYIQNVKKQTGHNKVNLIPVSLGGSIATAYFDEFRDKNDVDKVCYFVPATDGSTLIADVMDKNLDFENQEELISMLFNKNQAEKIKKLISRFSKETVSNIINSAVDGVLDEFFKNCSGMWAVVPQEKYMALAEKLISDEKHKVLKEKTDKYYKAQSNLREILVDAQSRGVRFFSICAYDLPHYPFGATKKINSDGIVDFKSGSLGGFSVPLGEKIADDYEPKYDRCKNKAHNHISPDRTVDLSTAIFPDTTFCFKGQLHDDIAYNNTALELCKEILTNEEFLDVYSDERFPQFSSKTNKNQ